jgi:hypothetical protein
MVSGAYLTAKRGLRVGKVDLLGLVVSPKKGQLVLQVLHLHPQAVVLSPQLVIALLISK